MVQLPPYKPKSIPRDIKELFKPIVPSAPHNDGREAPLLQMIYCPESLQTKL
jgi:hypothetical protein